jgi:hypothetical protein
MDNPTKILLILITCFTVNLLAGCAAALHGPCKTLSYDLRPGQGKLGPDVCLTDRCLGWMVGRNNGPFYHLGQGTLDPGCGPDNSGSLIRGTQTLLEQFPSGSNSPGQLLTQTGQPTSDQLFQHRQAFQQQQRLLQQQPTGQLLQQPPVIPQAFFDPFQP